MEDQVLAFTPFLAGLGPCDGGFPPKANHNEAMPAHCRHSRILLHVNFLIPERTLRAKASFEERQRKFRGQKVGYGMVVDGIAKFQALKFTFQGLKLTVKSFFCWLERESLRNIRP